jgi:hypothetical protein
VVKSLTDAVVGSIKGTGKIVNAVVATVSASAIVKTTAEMGGDVGKAAKSAIEGTITEAKEVGLNVEEGASAAATGALRGAGEVSSTAVEQVRNAVTGVIAGIKVVVKEPFK